MFLKQNRILPTVKSTTRLNTAQFTDYIEKIKRWASKEYGIVLPEAEDIWVDYEEEVQKQLKQWTKNI